MRVVCDVMPGQHRFLGNVLPSNTLRACLEAVRHRLGLVPVFVAEEMELDVAPCRPRQSLGAAASADSTSSLARGYPNPFSSESGAAPGPGSRVQGGLVEDLGKPPDGGELKGGRADP